MVVAADGDVVGTAGVAVDRADDAGAAACDRQIWRLHLRCRCYLDRRKRASCPGLVADP